MKNMKMILAAVAFVAGIGSAFATKPMAQRNLWVKPTSTTCSIISCSTIDRDLGDCLVSGTKYSNSSCTAVFTGNAYIVTNP